MAARWFPVPLTARHLRVGLRSLCTRCPVALALREATGLTWHVSERTAVPAYASHLRPWRFSPTVRHLIADLDAGRLVQPTVLRVPRRFMPTVKEVFP